MQYISTRGEIQPQSFSDTVLMGLTPEGGLTLPESYPKFSSQDLQSLRSFDYQALAMSILSKFVSKEDIPEEDLEKIIKKTYTKNTFGTGEITPLEQLSMNMYLLDLSRGPTLSFKDVALQLLGNLFEYILAKRNSFSNILGATSGDTGSAAEEGVDGKSNLSIFMLFPLTGMAHFQGAQMCRRKSPNVTNIAVEGNFDNCQDMVKLVNRDSSFKEKYKLGAVNSINWARVAAQVVYYFKGYFAATKANNQVVDFAVPTGNFGDILAGYIAKQMGLPIRHLYLATNENNVLEEFFRKGVYLPRSEVITTSSPSMDIQRASNFERLMYGVLGRNPAKLRSFMAAAENGLYVDIKKSVDSEGRKYWDMVENSGIIAGTSTHQDRLNIIRIFYERYGRLVDPHTADGIKVGYEKWNPEIPLIFLETAKPVKFETTIREAIGKSPEMPSWYKPDKDYEPDSVIKAGDINGLKRIIEKRALR